MTSNKKKRVEWTDLYRAQRASAIIIGSCFGFLPASEISLISFRIRSAFPAIHSIMYCEFFLLMESNSFTWEQTLAHTSKRSKHLPPSLPSQSIYPFYRTSMDDILECIDIIECHFLLTRIIRPPIHTQNEESTNSSDIRDSEHESARVIHHLRERERMRNVSDEIYLIISNLDHLSRKNFETKTFHLINENPIIISFFDMLRDWTTERLKRIRRHLKMRKWRNEERWRQRVGQDKGEKSDWW